MSYMMIRVYAPTVSVEDMNAKINESAKPHDGVIKLRNLMDAVLAGCIDAQVDVAVRNISQEINPTVGPATPEGSPDLGTSKEFAALAGSGITNTGTSTFTGDIGSHPTSSIVGITEAMVDGTLYTASSPIVAQAKIDATAAYVDLTTRVATPITAVLDGQTLTAGVYSTGAASLAASGNATLTFSGSATDIFIIQTASTLVTGAGGTPTMTLTGGALASNIYWAVGSSATINSGSIGTFEGAVIASASITDTLGGTVNGSLIALNGAVTYSAAGGTTSNSTLSLMEEESETGSDTDGLSAGYNHL